MENARVNSLTQEQLFLLNLSSVVWQKRGAAKLSHLPFNEETITETILLELKTSYPGSVQVVAYNKTQEGKTGADWLWSFVNSNGSQSFSMLVQAKRLEDKEQTYPKIKRNIGSRNPPVRQIDQLISTANSYNMPAVYAFYNHVTDTTRVPKTCGSLDPDHMGQILGFGISVADAVAVRNMLPDETFKSHKIHSKPLHCLLCSQGGGVRPTGGTPEMLALAYNNLPKGVQLEGTERDYVGLHEGLHPVVSSALELDAVRADGGKDFDLDTPSNVAGVIVLKDAQDTKE